MAQHHDDNSVMPAVASSSAERPAPAEDAPVSSWMHNLFQQPNPLRTSLRDWSQKKATAVGFSSDQTGGAQKPAKLPTLTDRESPGKIIPAGKCNEVSIEMQPRNSLSDAKPAPTIIKRKSNPAPVPPVRDRVATVRSNFSYDTLKERADIWKRERNKQSVRSAILEKDESVIPEGNHDPTAQTVPELNQGTPVEDNQRTKICFTKEESDKVDKDILRLMGALEHNRYPFNRDKQHLFAKLRPTRRKQMGLLFAHRELDSTNYFDTDQEMFGYDVVADKMATMYNVIDSISRDVYELREHLYYERRNQVPPRRGSSDRRVSDKPSDSSASTQKSSLKEDKQPSRENSIKSASSSTPPSKPTRSPNRPILKHSVSAESFKSAASDDTNATITRSP